MSASERAGVWEAMDAPADDAIALSAAGAARRERMLADVSRAAGARRARRVVVRAAAVCVIACGVMAAAWVGTRGGATTGSVRGGAEIAGAGEHRAAPAAAVREEIAERSAIRVEVVSVDPRIIERYAAAAPNVENVSDAELVRLMQEMGKPTGIVRTNGRVMLTADLHEEDAARAPTSLRTPEAAAPARS